jgi:hypothetical protein
VTHEYLDSFKVHISKSSTHLDSWRNVDCWKWRVGRLVVGAWNFVRFKICLCNVFICHWGAINNMKPWVTIKLQRGKSLILEHFSYAFYEFFEFNLSKFLALGHVYFVGEFGLEVFLPLGCVCLHLHAFVFIFMSLKWHV